MVKATVLKGVVYSVSGSALARSIVPVTMIESGQAWFRIEIERGIYERRAFWKSSSVSALACTAEKVLVSSEMRIVRTAKVR